MLKAKITWEIDGKEVKTVEAEVRTEIAITDGDMCDSVKAALEKVEDSAFENLLNRVLKEHEESL